MQSWVKQWCCHISLLLMLLASGCGGGGGSSLTLDAQQNNSLKPTLTVLAKDTLSRTSHQPTRRLNGVAHSPYGLREIVVRNVSTQWSSSASGLAQWHVELPLAQGDNRIEVSALDQRGESQSTQLILTHHPAAQFTNALTLSRALIFNQTGTTVDAHIGHSSSQISTLNLFYSDRQGQLEGLATRLLDNGVDADSVAGDQQFSGRMSLAPETNRSYCFRAQAITLQGDTTLSNVACLWSQTPLSKQSIQSVVDLANTAKAWLSQSRDAKWVSEQLDGADGVAFSGDNGFGDVWWVMENGLFGYALADAHITPTPLQHELMRQLPSGNDPLTSLGSPRAAYLGPFLAPASPHIPFAQDDDYHKAWLRIREQRSCSVYADAESVNQGEQRMQLSDYRDLDQGYIHIGSRASALFQQIKSHWQSTWGNDAFLQGSDALTLLASGVALPSLDEEATPLPAQLLRDLLAHRLAIGPDAQLGLLPAFFDRHLTALPQSLVVLSADFSTFNHSLAHAFLRRGAQTVLGFDQAVKRPFAQAVIDDLVALMYRGNTLNAALTQVRASHGIDDADHTPAALSLSGQAQVRFAQAQFLEPGFEKSPSAIWQAEGNADVVLSLGDIRPSAGQRMGLLGSSAHTGQSSLSQQACLTPDVRHLQFDWQFLSEEFNEFCQSPQQDRFEVALCELSPQTDAGSCATIYQQSVGSLCGDTIPTTLKFDQGDVQRTGWQRTALPIAAFADKKTKVQFRLIDGGGFTHDSALLIDNIVWIP